MNKKQYEQFKANFNSFMQSNDLNNLSALENTEAYFSWQACDCCKSNLGGNRIDCNGYSPSNGILEFSVCLDCLYFAEYGCLDDMTMLSIED